MRNEILDAKFEAKHAKFLKFCFVTKMQNAWETDLILHQFRIDAKFFFAKRRTLFRFKKI